MKDRTFLLAVSELLQQETDIDRVLGRIVELVARAMDADRATLFLVDRDRRQLYSRAAHLPELDEIRVDLGSGIAGYVAESRQSVFVPGPDDARFSPSVDEQTGYQTRSLLAVPVVGSDQAEAVIGVLEALNKRGADGFDDDDRIQLEALAGAVGEALVAAQLDDSRNRPARYNRIIGASEVMADVYERIANAATTDATVLIRGESGTGKELAARAIHANSRRASGPFVKVDCTTLPETLVEAELFGHERGAFTGASRSVPGKCEGADGGTLFLDEIGELSVPVQAKLLRFVQDREFERVGGRDLRRADVRIVAATHRNLEEMVEREQFRRDLYYRIRVVTIELPPLRERGNEDIHQLSRHFVRMYARRHDRPARDLSDAALRQLAGYRWPGNIRELEHDIESAVIFCREERIEPKHLRLSPGPAAAADVEEPQDRTLAEVERRHIENILNACGGNRTRAATLLGIGRNTLNRKLKQYGIV